MNYGIITVFGTTEQMPNDRGWYTGKTHYADDKYL